MVLPLALGANVAAVVVGEEGEGFKECVVVDALLGIGLTGKLRPPIKQVVEKINSMKAFRVAVDVPTGINSDTGEVLGTAVKSDLTVTFYKAKSGLAKAKEYLMTGDLISATEAERIGLINHVVPPDEVMHKAIELAQRLANGPTKAIRWTKLACNKRLRDDVNLVLDASLATETLTMLTEDHQEASRAFAEKRAPQFKGY